MSWQEELKKGIRRAEELAPILGWSEEETAERAAVAERFPMMITPYYLSLVDPADPRDPIGRMCIPSPDEFDPGGSFDTSGEASNTKLEGLQHKYAQTVLLLSTNQCAMYCRHCFRKRMVGLSEDELNRRVDEAVAYVKQREQFGKPLSAFQNTQFVIANLSNQIEAARLLVYRAAWAKDNHLPYSVESAHAKLFAAETAMRVTTECVQLLGGYGYTREYPVERMMRDAKITQIYEGTSEVQRMVISRALLK